MKFDCLIYLKSMLEYKFAISLYPVSNQPISFQHFWLSNEKSIRKWLERNQDIMIIGNRQRLAKKPVITRLNAVCVPVEKIW